MAPASDYFRRVTKESADSLVKASASGRQFICGAMRISHTPYAPAARGVAEYSYSAPHRERCSPRRIGFFRALDACCGYLMKYSLPVSKAETFDGLRPAQPLEPSASSRPDNMFREGRVKPKLKDSGPGARARSPKSAGVATSKDNKRSRCLVRAKGEDSQGQLRKLRKNCYVGTGKRAARHMGASLQQLGDPPYLRAVFRNARNRTHAIGSGAVPTGNALCVLKRRMRLRPTALFYLTSTLAYLLKDR